MICVNCRKEIPDGAAVCPECGAVQKRTTPAPISNMGNNVNSRNQEVNRNGKVDNTLIWIQAFMPLLGALFMFGTVVTFLINSVILYFDCEKLKKAGYDVEPMGSSWVVPVYIYNRKKYFNHGNGYFITWCITFGLSFLGFV